MRFRTSSVLVISNQKRFTIREGILELIVSQWVLARERQEFSLLEESNPKDNGRKNEFRKECD
jgi:hypothetical protein